MQSHGHCVSRDRQGRLVNERMGWVDPSAEPLTHQADAHYESRGENHQLLTIIRQVLVGHRHHCIITDQRTRFVDKANGEYNARAT